MLDSAKVYSYARWSTPEQGSGDSNRRQLESAERWAAEHQYFFDRNLRIVDQGLSAYRGDNAIDGGLGGFLRACRQGLIEPGSILLVESLDRISRMTPRRAQRVMDEIVDSGITIVTLCDNQRYTAERLDADPMALLLALMVSWRAHEESRTKASRVAAAWAEKRRRIRADPSERFTRRGPSWLLPSGGGGWEEDKEKSDTVRRIFAMTLSGFGEHRIAATLNEQAIPTFCGGTRWHRSTVSKLLRNPAVIGKLTPGRIEHINGRRLRVLEDPIDGVFPPIVTVPDWLAVKALKDGRSGGPRGQYAGNGVAHYLAGIAKCPKCEATMVRVNKGATAKCGKPKLVCSVAKSRAGCQYVAVPVGRIESALLSKWSALLDGDGRTERPTDRRGPANDANMAFTAGVIAQLREVLSHNEQRSDRTRVNTVLKMLFANVKVDYLTSTLHFRWRAGGEGLIGY